MSAMKASTLAGTPASAYARAASSRSFSPHWWTQLEPRPRTAPASARGTASFNARAPWLPPSTRRRSGAPRPASRCAGGGSVAISLRTGLPDRLLALREAAGEAGEEAAREPRQHAVGEARRAVLFVHQQRPALQPGGDSRRGRRQSRRS
jgi:hypothetical protein